MEASQINRGIMDEEDEQLGSPSSPSSDDSSSAVDSSSSDLMEDATSSSSSSMSSSSSNDRNGAGAALYEMSSLMAQLPFKRGLSKHFQGKSQSFTSLSNVRCLEDLAKPERPYKKLKACKSYGGGLDRHNAHSSPRCCSKTISKKPSRGSLSSLIAKRHSFLGSSRPPIPPHRSSNISNHETLLF